jgi:hypothetical protein
MLYSVTPWDETMSPLEQLESTSPPPDWGSPLSPPSPPHPQLSPQPKPESPPEPDPTHWTWVLFTILLFILFIVLFVWFIAPKAKGTADYLRQSFDLKSYMPYNSTMGD